MAACLALTACGGSDSSDGSASKSGGKAGSGTSNKKSSEKKVDACALLTDAEVTPLIGKNEGGKPGGGVAASSCEWQNPDTYSSITLDIGSAGTAPGGKLPKSDFGKTEDGPDGIRFTQLNIAEFAIDDRACDIQVVTSVTDDSDRPTAIRLIGLVRGRY